MRTRSGEAVVVKVHRDGDVECEWKGWEGRYCLWKNELYVMGGTRVRKKIVYSCYI